MLQVVVIEPMDDYSEFDTKVNRIVETLTRSKSKVKSINITEHCQNGKSKWWNPFDDGFAYFWYSGHIIYEEEVK